MEDATLNAVTWAFFRTLQTKGIYEDVSKVQHQLERFVHTKKRKSLNIEYSVMDFNKCDVVQLRKLKDPKKKYSDFRLLIENVTQNHPQSDPLSSYSFEFEHILVTKKNCMKVISEYSKEGKRCYLCRNNCEIGIPREQRIPKIDANSVDYLYRIDTMEIDPTEESEEL